MIYPNLFEYELNVVINSPAEFRSIEVFVVENIAIIESGPTDLASDKSIGV